MIVVCWLVITMLVYVGLLYWFAMFACCFLLVSLSLFCCFVFGRVCVVDFC